MVGTGALVVVGAVVVVVKGWAIVVVVKGLVIVSGSLDVSGCSVV